MARYSLSPSRIARYFYHECERHLRYHATAPADRPADGIPTLDYDRSPVTAAILEGGYEWEEKVVAGLGDRVQIAAGDGPLRDRNHSIAATLELLRTIQPGQSIYQPTLGVPQSFLARYGLDPELVEFRPCRPDVIECNADGRLQIVDVKASDQLKASHRVQVALYVILLQELLADAGIDRPVEADTGYIWLYAEPRPQAFDLALTRGALEAFLRDRLAGILGASARDVPWHLFYRCEWCEFYSHCRAEAEGTSSVSLLPYLSVGARRYLREAPWPDGQRVDTLDDLRALLASPKAPQALEACGSLRGQAQRLRNRLQALAEDRVVAHGGSSLAMPVNENVSLIVTLQREPVSGRIYAAGFRRLKGREVYDEPSNEQIFVADSPEDCDRVRSEFLQHLFYELGMVHQYNAEREWKDQKSVQTYVFDGYEWRLFQELLVEAVQVPELVPLAVPLLFHFQDERLAEKDEHPRREVPFPMVILTGVLRELLALPAPLVLRLDDVSAALPAPGFDYRYHGRELFNFELSNALKSDAVFQAWNKGRVEAAGWIFDELHRRLVGVGAVVDGLRAQIQDRLFAWPPKFYMPARTEFRNPELSRLEFVVRYESFMGAMEARSRRTRPLQERLDSGLSIPVRYRSGGWWDVLTTLDDAEVDASGFLDRLLVPAGEDGERAQMSYDDYRNREASYAPRAGLVRLAKIPQKDVDPRTGRVRALRLGIVKGRDQEPFERDAEAVLHPRFTDFTSGRIVDRLAALDREPDADFVTLVRDPLQFATDLRESDPVRRAIYARLDEVALTASQKATLILFLTRRLTIVWGPPGTGKTWFLAQAIRLLTAGRAAAGEPIRIGVTAFTHAAIENLLRTLGELTAGVPGSSLQVLKIGELQRPADIEVVANPEAARFAERAPQLVMGGTVYGLRKARERGQLRPFDVLIVDEGSQMKLGELALATMALAPGGRLVIAGDDLQLPPMIRGVYPEPEDGLPGLMDSAFAYLRHRCPEHTGQLAENWRMNATLSAFPAATLYGPSYRPATPELAARRLQLRSGSSASALVEWLLDPDWPLALCLLEGVRATAENRLEAELVADLALELRGRMVDPVSAAVWPDSASGDREFWRRGLFVVSPHHVQIRAIHAALAGRRDWQSTPFVDTVDKMQGQQSEAVIVSYGVSDGETALAEAHFLYSLNRLNVATTRARSKCLVFLPQPLLEPSFELLSDERAARGLGHMHGLAAFCRNNGEERVFGLPDGVRLRVLRARVVPPR